MAIRYYDDIVAAKIKKWMPDEKNLRILKPDETKRLFETLADDSKDQKFKLPCIALSRNNDIELLLNVKSPRSFDGWTIDKDEKRTKQLNAIPISVQYQLDIYTKTFEQGDEYLRQLLFKLINNPLIRIDIPYNDTYLTHTANIRVLPTVSDTSAISERIFSGQFTRWTIQFEIQDAFLFSVKYRNNWRLYVDDEHILPEDQLSTLELVKKLGAEDPDDEIEVLNFNFKQ